MNRLWMLVVLFAGLAVYSLPVAQAAPASTMQQLTRESVIEQVVQRGTLRVGLDVFVPWAMKDKKGELIGMEVDVAKKVAQDMGVKVEFVPTTWSGIIPALMAGKFDMIIGGMTMTPERNLKVNFTHPYYYVGQGLLANRKMTESWKLDDFNKPSVTLAVRMGSTAAVAARARFPKATLRMFDDEPSALQEVRNGRAHGMISGQPLPTINADKYPDLLKAYPDQLTKEPICIAVRKGDVDTLNFLNNWIEATQDSGWMTEQYNYWFGATKWQSLVQ